MMQEMWDMDDHDDHNITLDVFYFVLWIILTLQKRLVNQTAQLLAHAHKPHMQDFTAQHTGNMSCNTLKTLQ